MADLTAHIFTKKRILFLLLKILVRFLSTIVIAVIAVMFTNDDCTAA